MFGCPRHYLRHVAAIALFLGIGSIILPNYAGAQTATNVSIRSLGKSTERKTLPVTVLAVGNGGAVLKPDDPKEANIIAYLARDTKYHRGPARALTPGFVVGEKVVVRLAWFGTGPKARVFVAELWDTGLYEEQQKLRKDVFIGVVRQTVPAGTANGFLTVNPKEGEIAATFKVTASTIFYRNDTRVPPLAYPVGAEVAVKPRSLPNGEVMAGIVAESPSAVDIAYRDTLTVWDGLVETVDPVNSTLVLKRNDGAKRTVLFPRDLTITTEGSEKKAGPRKLYYLAELTKKAVVIHLKRGEKPGPNGLRTASRISVAGDSVDALTPPDKTREAREQEREDPPAR